MDNKDQNLEQNLGSIIEEWQKKFFEDYIQPKLEDHYNKIEERIIKSMNKN